MSDQMKQLQKDAAEKIKEFVAEEIEKGIKNALVVMGRDPDIIEKEIRKLRADLEIAREALFWYSHEKNYRMAWRPDIERYVAANTEGSEAILVDDGKRAREALKKMGEK